MSISTPTAIIAAGIIIGGAIITSEVPIREPSSRIYPQDTTAVTIVDQNAGTVFVCGRTTDANSTPCYDLVSGGRVTYEVALGH